MIKLSLHLMEILNLSSAIDIWSQMYLQHFGIERQDLLSHPCSCYKNNRSQKLSFSLRIVSRKTIISSKASLIKRQTQTILISSTEGLNWMIMLHSVLQCVLQHNEQHDALWLYEQDTITSSAAIIKYFPLPGFTFWRLWKYEGCQWMNHTGIVSF